MTTLGERRERQWPVWVTLDQRWHCGARGSWGTCEARSREDFTFCPRCANATIHYCGRQYHTTGGPCATCAGGCDGGCGHFGPAGTVTRQANRGGMHLSRATPPVDGNGCNCPDCYKLSFPELFVDERKQRVKASAGGRNWTAFADDPIVG